MMRYNSPFGISTQMSKTMIKLPVNAPSTSLNVWTPTCKKKFIQNNVQKQSKLLESKLSITNLTVDSNSFRNNEYKSEKREKKDLSQKLKIVWHMKRRQSIVRREQNKRKGNLNRCFSLKSKQATIHSVHSTEQTRFSLNSWNQSFIDRAIQNLSVELKQLFNLRQFKKKETSKTQQNEKVTLIKTAYITSKHRENSRKIRQNKNDNIPNKYEISKKQNIRGNEWLPWNQHSLRRNIKQNEKEVVAEWYDRNFSISLS